VEDFYCQEVLSGRRAVEVVAESDHYLAFKHTRPAYSGVHVLVVPKAHVASLISPPDELAVSEMIEILQQVTREVLSAHGVARVVTNLGDYQESKHLHWHVVAGDRLAEPVEVEPGAGARAWVPR